MFIVAGFKSSFIFNLFTWFEGFITWVGGSQTRLNSLQEPGRAEDKSHQV
jgi:hypothetical protein